VGGIGTTLTVEATMETTPKFEAALWGTVTIDELGVASFKVTYVVKVLV